jgi:hypothetical protein
MNVTPAEGNNWTVFVGEPTNLVERIIAPLEENPATVAYATGRQIIYDDWLWEVIDDIAVGDPLIDYAVDPTNANIKKAVPVETQLLDVKKKEGNLTDLHTTNKTNLVAAVNEVKDDLDDLSDDVGTLSALDTNVKTSAVAAINEVNTKVSKTEVLISNSGDAYSTSKVYKVGDLCIHDDKLYRCITPCSAGSWATNQSCFAADTLTGVVNTLSNNSINGRIISSFTVSSSRTNKEIFADIDTILSANWSKINLAALKIKWGDRIFQLSLWTNANGYQFTFVSVGTYVYIRTLFKNGANDFRYYNSQNNTITNVSTDIATAGETVTIYC